MLEGLDISNAFCMQKPPVSIASARWDRRELTSVCRSSLSLSTTGTFRGSPENNGWCYNEYWCASYQFKISMQPTSSKVEGGSWCAIEAAKVDIPHRSCLISKPYVIGKDYIRRLEADTWRSTQHWCGLKLERRSQLSPSRTPLSQVSIARAQALNHIFSPFRKQSYPSITHNRDHIAFTPILSTLRCSYYAQNWLPMPGMVITKEWAGV